MQNMIFKRKLPIPKEIKEQYPLTAEACKYRFSRHLIAPSLNTPRG